MIQTMLGLAGALVAAAVKSEPPDRHSEERISLNVCFFHMPVEIKKGF
jgi:hypothetical protein